MAELTNRTNRLPHLEKASGLQFDHRRWMWLVATVQGIRATAELSRLAWLYFVQLSPIAQFVLSFCGWGDPLDVPLRHDHPKNSQRK